MNVYILYRNFYHYIDGETKELLNVYANFHTAQEKCNELTLTKAYGTAKKSVWFEVVEEFLI